MIARHAGSCKPHEFQDSEYGVGFRLLNPVMEKDRLVGGRCTVCGPPKEHSKKRGGIYSLDQLQILRR